MKISYNMMFDVVFSRLFPINETFLFRSEAQNSENILVSSSNDWTIRLWWKVIIWFAVNTKQVTHLSRSFLL